MNEKLENLIHIAKDPTTPPDTLRKLINHRNWIVKTRAISNPSCPLDVLENVAYEKDKGELGIALNSYVYNNPAAPERLQLIARSAELVRWIRMYVSFNLLDHVHN